MGNGFVTGHPQVAVQAGAGGYSEMSGRHAGAKRLDERMLSLTELFKLWYGKHPYTNYRISAFLDKEGWRTAPG